MSSFLTFSGLRGGLGDSDGGYFISDGERSDNPAGSGGIFLDTQSSNVGSNAATGNPPDSALWSSILNTTRSAALAFAPAAVQALSPNVPQGARSFLNMFIPTAAPPAIRPGVAADGVSAGTSSPWLKWGAIAAGLALVGGVIAKKRRR